MEESDGRRESLERLYNVLSSKIAKAPNSAPMHTQLGAVCLELDRREEALQYFRRALRIDPSLADVKAKLQKHFGEAEIGDMVTLVDPIPFWKDLRWTFAYPLAKEGKITIFAGAFLFSMLHALPVVGVLLVLFFVYPFLTAYMLKIVRSAAEGERQMPGWPEATEALDSILLPSLRFLAALTVSFAPLILLIAAGLPFSVSLSVRGIVFLSAFGLGAVYLPIALIAVAWYENGLAALNLPLLIRSLFIMKRDYLLALLFLAPTLLVGSILSNVVALPVPILGLFFYWTANLYLFTLQMNVIGNLYYVNADKLKWP
jgi:tetratricopeptide (TPR) repeat protein